MCVHACMSIFIHSPNTLCSYTYVHTVCVCACLSTTQTHVCVCVCRICMCTHVSVCLYMVSSLCVWVKAYSCGYKCPLRPNMPKLSLETGQCSKYCSPCLQFRTLTHNQCLKTDNGISYIHSATSSIMWR